MKKRILCLFLAVLSLVSVVALPLSAAGVTPQQTEIVDFSKTTVEDDLIGSTFTSALGISQKIEDADDIKRLYPKTLIGEPHIISVVESGYDTAQGSASNVSLYVYVYDPTASCVIESEGNSITLANSYNFRPVDGEAETNDATKWEAKGYKTYSLSYVSISEDKTVIKYHVDGFDFKNNVFSGVRRYDISRIDLVDVQPSQGAELKAYTVGEATICTGSVADGNYKTSTTGFDVLEISDIRQTHFLYNNLSREHYQTEIHSVYFSIPNEYVEKYKSNLYYITYSARRERSTPMVVTRDQELYHQLLEYQGRSVDVANPPELSVGYYERKGERDWAWYEWGWAYNQLSYKKPADVIVNSSDILYWIFAQKTETGEWASSLDDTYVKTEDVLALYNAFKKANYTDHLTLMENGLVQDYDVAYKETGYTYGFFTEKIYATDPQDTLKGYTYSNGFHKFFSDLFGIEHDEIDLSQTDSIQLLASADVLKLDKLTDAEISKQYLVAEQEVSDFKAFCKSANSSGETVIVMHFANSLYFSRNCVVESDWALGTRGQTSGLAYVAVEDMFLNFTLIEMAFGDATAYTVIPLVTQPIDVMPGPEDPPEKSPGWSDVGKDPAKGTQDIARILAILLVVAIVVLVIYLYFKYLHTPFMSYRRKRRYQGKNRRSRNKRNYNNRRYKR